MGLPLPQAPARAESRWWRSSPAGENYYNGGRIDLTIGNTAVVAALVADLMDVDVYEIRAAEPYPDDYGPRSGGTWRNRTRAAGPASPAACPTLRATTRSCSAAVSGTSRAPMIMRTFVEALDFTGKTVLPFVTYAVSGMGRVADEYAQTLPGATLGDGLAVRGEEASGARGLVEDWLRRSSLIG